MSGSLPESNLHPAPRCAHGSRPRHAVWRRARLGRYQEHLVDVIATKAHRGQVMRTMPANSLPELVTMATRQGLLPVGDGAAIGINHW